MIKRFLKHGLFYSLVTLLSRGISFLLLPIYTHVLSPADFGAIDMLTLLGIILNLLVALEVMQGVARFLPETVNQLEKKEILSSALWFTLTMYVLTAAVLWIAQKPICLLLLEDLKWLATYRIAVISVTLNGLFLFFQNSLRWQVKARQSGAVSLIYSLFTAFVAVVLVGYFEMGVDGIYWGYIVGAMVSIALALWFDGSSYLFIFTGPTIRRLLKFSIPLVPSSAAVFLALYVDRIIVKEYMGLTNLGLYSVAAKFASVISLLITGFSSALTPLIYQEYKNPETPLKLAKLTSFYFVISFGLICVFSFFSREILMVFTEKSFYDAAPYIALLTLNTVTYSAYIFTPGLSLAQKTGIIALINIVSGILNLVLNLLFVPAFGLYGAILSTLASALVCFILNLYYNNRFYRIPFDLYRIVLFYVLALAVIFTAPFMDAGLSFTWLLLKGAMCAVLIGIGFFLIVNMDYIKSLSLKKSGNS